MKRLLYIVLSLVLMVPSSFGAPKKSKGKPWYTKGDDFYHVSVYGGAGYSGLVGNYTSQSFGAGSRLSGQFDYTMQGGGGMLAGVAWEHHHKRFVYSVGPEIRLLTNVSKIGLSVDVPRDDYPTMVQHYRFSRLRETETIGQVMVPLLFGAQFERYYFLAGAKVGFSFAGGSRQRGGLTTNVSELQAIEEWSELQVHSLVSTEDMYEHPLYVGDGKSAHSWGLDVALSAEFGVNLNALFSSEWNEANEQRNRPWRMRASVFIDYGLPMLSVASATPYSMAEVGPINELYGAADKGTVSTQSVHGSAFADKALSSLLVGVKFTALLQLNKQKVPNPRIYFQVTDTMDRPTRQLARVEIRDVDKPKRKIVVKNMKQNGTLSARFAAGNYAMVAKADGYLPSDYAGDTLFLTHKKDMDTVLFVLLPDPPKPMEVIPPVEEVKPMDPPVFVFHHIYFALNRTEILETSGEDLQTLYTFLTDNPTLRILITGHTDSQGSEAYNQRLSEGRAASVKKAMVERGIDPNRILTAGKGESEPIDTNATAEGRQNNRRVEVAVIAE